MRAFAFAFAFAIIIIITVTHRVHPYIVSPRLIRHVEVQHEIKHEETAHNGLREGEPTRDLRPVF